MTDNNYPFVTRTASEYCYGPLRLPREFDKAGALIMVSCLHMDRNLSLVAGFAVLLSFLALQLYLHCLLPST
jgi:hypothetical protein